MVPPHFAFRLKIRQEINERKFTKGENTEKGYLTAKQANYIHRKVESGNLIIKKCDETGDRSRCRVRQNGRYK